MIATTTLYVAYGSNLNLAQMARRCPAAQAIGPVWVRDWRLVMRGVADIEPRIDDVVPAGLWEITPACERALDTYEGYPRLYIKRDVIVHLANGETAVAMAYVMRYGRVLPYAPAHQGYLGTIREGYQDFGLESHLETLWHAQRRALRSQNRSTTRPQKRA
jgi:hypothetical protein